MHGLKNAETRILALYISAVRSSDYQDTGTVLLLRDICRTKPNRRNNEKARSNHNYPSTMETATATSALGPVAASSGTSGMDELMPLVLQLTNAEQVRKQSCFVSSTNGCLENCKFETLCSQHGTLMLYSSDLF
jgi:hypothetical protein